MNITRADVEKAVAACSGCNGTGSVLLGYDVTIGVRCPGCYALRLLLSVLPEAPKEKTP